MALSERNAGIFAESVLAARHVFERIPWPAHGSTPESTARGRAEIEAAGYDVALIASEEPEAYALAAGIRQRIGFTTGWAKPLKSLWIARRTTRTVRRSARVGGERAHEAEVMFRLGAGFTRETAPTRDVARLRALILSDPAPVARRSVVVQLGPKWMQLGLDVATAGAIVATLAARGATLVVAPGEREAADRIAGALPYIISGTLEGWKRTLDGARIVVSPDTGAAHLAGMLGVPVVVCFPDAGAPAQIKRWHPWAGPYVALTASELRGGAGIARIEDACDGF
jgi:ADP-heptose:LPS heptosyltransferase